MQPRFFGSAALVLLASIAALGDLRAQTLIQQNLVIQGPDGVQGALPGEPVRDPGTPAPKGTGVIRGRVTAADSGNPLRRAQVLVTAADVRVMQSANTDSDGRYEIANLPAGRYTIAVRRSGYVTLQFGQQRPLEPGKPLTLADKAVADKIDFALPRGSVITGKITDELGEPIAGARVQAMRYQYMSDGQRQLVPGNVGPGGGGGPFGIVTDDLGQFRVYGLMPGTYVLSASSAMSGMMTVSFNGSAPAVNQNSDPDDGYVTTYYPGTANPDEAQAITVELGQEASAYFSLVQAHMSRISGFVRNSQGQAAGGLMIMLRPGAGAGNARVAGGPNTSGGQTAPDGSFTLTNVPPGEHILDIRPLPRPIMIGAGGAQSTATDPEFASVPISVGGQDLTGLVITTTPGATISGQLVFEGTRPAPRGESTNSTRMMATSAGSSAGPLGMFAMADNGVVDASGHFEIRGVGGRVLFRPAQLPPGGWFLKSVTLNGVDLTDTPYEPRGSANVTGLEIRLTDQQTTLTGAVRNSRGETIKDYVIAILPDNLKEGALAARFTRTVRPDQNGQYKTQGLPAGEYLAFAVESLEQGGLFDPAYQQVMKPKAKSFRLTDGQALTLDLPLVE